MMGERVRAGFSSLPENTTAWDFSQAVKTLTESSAESEL